MFHSDIVAAMEASPIVTRYPVETSNLKYSPWRSPHGNYRCPKFHDAAFFSTLNDYSFSLSLSLSVWQPQEPEWKNVCGKKVSLLFDSAGFSPSTIESQRSRVLAGKRLSIDIESEDERHCRSVGLSLLIQISRTPLDINHSLPLCTPYGNPYVHTQEPWTTTPERLFRFKSRQKEYGFPLLPYETQFHGSATITARRVFRADRFLQGHLGFCSSFVLCLLRSVCVIGRPRIFVHLQWCKNTHNMERYVKYRKYNILVIIFNGRNESLSWINF